MNIEKGKRVWRNSAGELHREDGPAVEFSNGDREWWVNGQRHRMNGPAVEWVNGTMEWYLNGYLHRTDGPAITTADFLIWCLNGKRHRTDGPAVEWEDGDREWWVNNQRHRTDGPAFVYANGAKQWFFRDKEISKPDLITQVSRLNLKIALLARVVNPFCEISIARYCL